MTRNIIYDGQTRDGYIAPIEGLHEGLTFKYRPFLPEQTSALDAKVMETRTDRKGTDYLHVAKDVTPQLTEWSEEDRHRKGVAPIDVQHVRRLPYALLRRVWMIVAGVEPSDPKDASQRTDEDVDEDIEAIRRGEDGITVAEAALGN